MDVFEWKSPGRGPRYRVSVGESSISIDRDGHVQEIGLEDITRVHVQANFSPPLSHMLHVEVIDETGKGVAFHDSGFGPADTDADACRAAAIALLSRLAVSPTSVDIYEGGRSDKPSRFFLAGVILLTVVSVAWALAVSLMETPERATGIALVLGACFIFGSFRSFRKTKSQKPVDAKDLLEELQNPEGYR